MDISIGLELYFELFINTENQKQDKKWEDEKDESIAIGCLKIQCLNLVINSYGSDSGFIRNIPTDHNNHSKLAYTVRKWKCNSRDNGSVLEKLEFYAGIDFFFSETLRHANSILAGSLQE